MYLRYLTDKKRKELADINQASDVSALGVMLRWKKPSFPKPALPKPTPGPASSALYTHILNDPTTPELVNSNAKVPPQIGQSPFAVQGFKGGGHPQGTAQFQAANAYVTIAETLNLANNYAAPNKIPHWPRTSALMIVPRAGRDLNAYYDGKSLRFFYASDARIGGTVYTVDSADIVSHECGHSILDCYRPDLWNAAYIEVGCFHESFGDFIALMHSLSHNEMLERVLVETNGNLTISNVISRIAEQFGKTIYKLNPDGRNPDFLRSAINDFKYANPNTLPEDAPDNQLAAEVHSFSRIFTGAIWDIFVMIYNDLTKFGKSQLESMQIARDWVCRYIMLAIQNAPLNARFFESVAKTIIWADTKLNNGKYGSNMREIFLNRNIISVDIQGLCSKKCPNANNIVRIQKTDKIKLHDFIACAQGAGSNPLYGVELTMPQESVELYDNYGNLIDQVLTTEEESVEAAQGLVHYLYNTNNYGPEQTTPWDVRNGKLIRTRTCCF